jgi:hypothetical protein
MPIADHPDTADGSSPPGLNCRIQRWIGWSGVAAVAVALTWQTLANPEFMHSDELGHLVVARDAWTRPELILNTWGRTANTLAYMPTAAISLTASRLSAVAMQLLACALAWSFARRAGLRLACLTPWLILLQPQFLDLGWGSVPQVPFTLELIGAAWLAQRGRWRMAALAAGLLALTRHEGIALTFAFGLFCLMRRDAIAALLTAAPPALVNLTSWLTLRALPFAVYFNPRPTDFYGTGPIRDYVFGLFHQAGLVLFLLALLGLLESPRRPALFFLAAWSALYFAIHALLFRFGLYATGGYLIFLTPLAPCLGILAASGVEEFVRRLVAAVAAGKGSGRRWSPTPARLEVCLVLALLLGVAGSGLSRRLLLPRPVAEVDASLDRAIAVLRERKLDQRPIVSVHPRVLYKLPAPAPNTDERLWYNTEPLDAMPVGTVAVWDSYHGDILGLPKSELDRPGGGWREVWTAAHTAIYEKIDLPPPPSAPPPPAGGH